MSISIGTPMPPRHAQSARKALHFGIRLSVPSSGWNDSDDVLTPVAGLFLQDLPVCHHGLTALALVNPNASHCSIQRCLSHTRLERPLLDQRQAVRLSSPHVASLCRPAGH